MGGYSRSAAAPSLVCAKRGWRRVGKGRPAGPAVGPSPGGDTPRVTAPGRCDQTPFLPRRVGGLWGDASCSRDEAGERGSVPRPPQRQARRERPSAAAALRPFQIRSVPHAPPDKTSARPGLVSWVKAGLMSMDSRMLLGSRAFVAGGPRSNMCLRFRSWSDLLVMAVTEKVT